MVTELQITQCQHSFRRDFRRQEIELHIDPSTAFVSYSREDWVFVLRLAKDLKAKGAKVWMDKLDIRPGQTWADEIQVAVNSCSRMLVVLSPASVASRNVQAEVGYAISEGDEIIPIFYRQCTIPFRLLPFQYADFRTDYLSGLEELLSSLSAKDTRTGAITLTANKCTDSYRLAGATAVNFNSGAKNDTLAAATAVPADTSVDDEERRRRSSIEHKRLAERYKRAAAEQAWMEQEERERAKASEKARRELESQRVAAEQARLEEDRKQSAAQKVLSEHQRAERKAAEERVTRQGRERQRVSAEQAPLAVERDLAAENRERSQQQGTAADQAHREHEFKPGPQLPAPPWQRSTRWMIVASTLCATIVFGSIVYGATSHWKQASPAVQNSQSRVTRAQEIPPKIDSPPPVNQPAPAPAKAQPETQAPSVKAEIAEPEVSPPSIPKAKSLNPVHAAPTSAPAAHELPEKSTNLPPSTTSASHLDAPADGDLPAGMSATLADRYRKARSGELEAMVEVGVAYHDGNGVAKDDTQAVSWYRKAAAAGNVRGNYELGVCYENGYGVPKDYAHAVDWYRKAAEAGNPRAMSSLGRMYDNGWGLPTDYRQAVTWYRKAAEAGDLQGMSSFGVMYEDGLGVQKDLRQAVNWYRKAAEGGNATGMFYLADMYESGKGVKKDLQQAFYWYRRAAEGGVAEGMNKVAAMCENGQGVQKDQQQAVLWYRKAAQVGNQNAMNNLKRLGDN